VRSIISSITEVKIILNRLTTNVAHHGTTGAYHFVTAIFLYEFLPTLPTGPEIDKIGNKEDKDTVKSF
jgi:hypothetical protein